MKSLLLLSISITCLLPSCNYKTQEAIQYDIYSCVLAKEFGHFSKDIPYIIGINDTVQDFKEELETLIYSVQNNELFFKEYCQGDDSYRDFILAIKPINTDTVIMDLGKLKAKTTINITLDKLIKPQPWHHIINFSKIIFNKNKNKAILFVAGSSSGSWFFVELTNKNWTVKHEILSWIS